MTQTLNAAKCKWIGLILASVIIVSCENEMDNQGEVVLSSATVEPDGSLSLNATARFDAEVIDVVGNPPLIYEWYLEEARGNLIVEDQEKGNQTQTSESFITVRGDNLGKERLRVKVLNEDTGNSLAEDILSFEITAPSGCFNEPLLFYRNNNWSNPAMAAIGLESDTRKTVQLSPENWLYDLTKNGRWFLRLDFSDPGYNYKIWMDACDKSQSKLLAEGIHIYSPTFGPNDKYMYYSARVQDPRGSELVRVNIETGEKVFISDFGVFSREPRISPDGNWVAFEHVRDTYYSNGVYAGSVVHLAVMPAEGGAAKLLVEVEQNDLAGYDWSPDSEHIIFNWHKQSGSSDTHTNGIYRVSRNGGNPSLIFAEPEGNGRPIYYADGTRIAFHGHPAGADTQYDIWSIDANGGDLQRLTDEKYNVFLSFIWE